MIHLYTGDGKGKTTAAVGLAVRMAGSGGTVLFCQFLKDGRSSEIQALIQLPKVRLFLPDQFFGFSFRMTDQVRQEAASYYQTYFTQIRDLQEREKFQLVVLDELIDACNAGLVPYEDLFGFLREWGKKRELVLTGRRPAAELEAYADYDTLMQKRKHPYDQGIKARIGIEK